MKRLVGAAVLGLMSTGCFAAEFGIGVSAKSDDAWVYAPIDFATGYRLEPSIRYSKRDDVVSQPSNVITSLSGDEQESRSFEIGLGAFRVAHPAEKARVYYGLRAAYVDSHTELTGYVSGSIFAPVTQYRYKSSVSGYRIAPTLGFEYLFGEHFSIGGEAALAYLDVDGKNTTTPTLGVATQQSTSQTSTSTQTALILRYMF